jgi:hypothetical protein
MMGQIQSAATKAGIPNSGEIRVPIGSRRHRHFSAHARAIFPQMTRMWTGMEMETRGRWMLARNPARSPTSGLLDRVGGSPSWNIEFTAAHDSRILLSTATMRTKGEGLVAIDSCTLATSSNEKRSAISKPFHFASSAWLMTRVASSFASAGTPSLPTKNIRAFLKTSCQTGI